MRPGDRPDPGAPDARSLVAGAVALLVAFLAGLGTGALVFDEPVADPSIPTAALFDDLGLTAEQTAHVDSVLAATRSSTGEVLEETRLELTTIANEALQAIDRVLTPEQIETVRARIEARARRPVPDSAADRPEPSG